MELANTPPLRFRNSGESSRCDWRSVEIVFQNLTSDSTSAIASSITAATGESSPLCQCIARCTRITAIASRCDREPFGSIILITVTFGSTKPAWLQASGCQRILAYNLNNLAGNWFRSFEEDPTALLMPKIRCLGNLSALRALITQERRILFGSKPRMGLDAVFRNPQRKNMINSGPPTAFDTGFFRNIGIALIALAVTAGSITLSLTLSTGETSPQINIADNLVVQ